MPPEEHSLSSALGGDSGWIYSLDPGERVRAATTETRLGRVLIITAALLFLGVFLVIPLIAVFTEAMRQGVRVHLAAITNPEARSAIRLTLLTAAIAVPLNLVFGLAASWAITRFDFRGKNLLTTLIDLPFAVSPVISGMIFVLLFGVQGLLGDFLARHGLKIIFAVPGIVLATTFVTFPFIARVDSGNGGDRPGGGTGRAHARR